MDDYDDDDDRACRSCLQFCATLANRIEATRPICGFGAVLVFATRSRAFEVQQTSLNSRLLCTLYYSSSCTVADYSPTTRGPCILINNIYRRRAILLRFLLPSLRRKDHYNHINYCCLRLSRSGAAARSLSSRTMGVRNGARARYLRSSR